MEQVSPFLRRREVAARLRMWRAAAGLTVEQVAQQLYCSPSKISRIETGQRRASLRDVRDLCDLYGVGRQSREETMSFVREANQRGWWDEYKNIGSNFAPFLGLEDAASRISIFHPSLVPGLFQVEEYMRGVLISMLPNAGPEEIDERISARLKRKEILQRSNGPKVCTIIDEAVLHRIVSGPAAMRKQLDFLLETGSQQSIEHLVIPFSAGSYRGLMGNFSIMDFDGPLAGSVVTEETSIQLSYLEQQATVELAHGFFGQFRSIALNAIKSAEMIYKIAKTYI